MVILLSAILKHEPTGYSKTTGKDFKLPFNYRHKGKRLVETILGL